MLRSMPQIRPVSDLRNKFAEISKEVHESGEPVILTKNGYADMVVISAEDYGSIWEDSVVIKLKEAELESKANPKRYTPEEVFAELNDIIVGKAVEQDV